MMASPAPKRCRSMCGPSLDDSASLRGWDEAFKNSVGTRIWLYGRGTVQTPSRQGPCDRRGMPQRPLFSRRAFVGTLFGLFAIHAVAIPMALHILFDTPRTDTIAGHVDRFARMSQAADSWRPMEAVRRVAAMTPNADLYEEIFFKQR